MFYFILVLLLTNVFSTNEEPERATTPKSRKKSFAALVFSSTTNVPPSQKESCQWLRRLKHQSKQCWKRRGLAKILFHAKTQSIEQCQSLFKYDQWNCSKRDFFFKKLYRETAFMYSLASSAVAYSVARACSEGHLPGCKCGDPGKLPEGANWQWGGCSDNSKFAKKFTKKFLQMKKKGDGLNAIVRYNTEIGINVATENEELDCKCHGVSGSCTVRVCQKKLDFKKIAARLKILYHNAILVKPGNTIRSFKGDKNAQNLLFLDSSPNFCLNTAGRQCNSTENCATVCCGRRPHSTEVTIRNDTCDCVFKSEKFNVDCEPCMQKKTVLTCP
ncbi:hypothetical protein Zmor_013125 [Zophobas morio]|uniref:Protein Wnt n=1 Tax=Zophobas morio TaxID=2755281 RepID=A0AA38IF24_9CUCU|nr:hypothetical protein Zmor_013125 [Zophobas morio]